MNVIRPIPDGHGVGFTAMRRIPEYADKYQEQQVGIYWNYLFTEANHCWPVHLRKFLEGKSFIIDGFSPNLNKALHVGHLRNLAIANSLKRLLGHDVKMVALLGASLGMYKWAEQAIEYWFNFLEYKPTVYYDVLMPWNLVPRYVVNDPELKTHGCEVWYDNPAVIVTTSQGKHTYNFHDIAFAAEVKPTHYLTGAEQKEHFLSLGLGDKHLPMGLVLGKDGKKMKSRKVDKDGNEAAESYTADEAMDELVINLGQTSLSSGEVQRLAWNVLAWNFLHTSRGQNVKFEADKWVHPDSPGMYISYTYARVRSALMESGHTSTHGPFINIDPFRYKAMKCNFTPDFSQCGPDENPSYEDAAAKWSKENPDEKYDLTQGDIELLGFAEYHKHWEIRSAELMDPAPLANFAHDLARKLGQAYHKERIKDGRYGFQYAVYQAWRMLGDCMSSLGMFRLNKV